MKEVNNYKGIILAGGRGTRLHPLTKVISKQLLPVYDQPMIFYPLKTLINAGLKEILLITNKEDIAAYKLLLENGSKFDVSIEYEIQEKPEGIAQAFEIGKKWLNKSKCALILGDNLFLAGNTSEKLKVAMNNNKGATIFGYKVKDPSRYGVVKFNENLEVINIIEKPEKPESDWAVTGLYVYDENVSNYFKSLKPSERGEYEITDLNNLYLKEDLLNIELIDEDSYWLDAGTKDSLLESSNIVKELKDKNIELY